MKTAENDMHKQGDLWKTNKKGGWRMKNGVKWMIIGGLWTIIFYLGYDIYTRKPLTIELPNPLMEERFDWKSIVKNQFVCEGKQEVERMIPYEEISRVIQEVSGGIITEVSIKKEESLIVNVKLTTNQQILKNIIPNYQKYETWLLIVAGMPITIRCMPDLSTYQWNITSIQVSYLSIPDSLIQNVSSVENAILKIVNRIEPFQMVEYQWKEDGLYWKGIVPIRIKGNSDAVFFALVEKIR